ncbi:hypothetical protein V8F20_009168 [Naviculisporaceae sp. PSN 640]
MIPSSVRRVVGVAPQSSPVVSSLAASAIPLARSYKSNSSHQRRYSSSKPSSKSSSSKPPASSSSDNGSSSHASSSTTVPSSSTSGEKRKAKAKVAATPTAPPAPALKLPSVPSTTHLKDEAIAMASFFALHRPISVTQILPKKVSNEAFARIFEQDAPTKPNWEDVISTLSQTTQQLQLQQQQMMTATAIPGMKPTFQLETSFQHQLDTMTGQFRPFNPPPAPEPMTSLEVEQDMAALEAEEGSETAGLSQTTTRVYKALVTIEETMDADGVLKVVAHSPEVVDDAGVEEEQPRGRFLERMALRQLQYEAAREQRRPTLHALSVKRQRKLKMKKKKYKKLMRKTRNIRRKLDRL